MNLYHLEKREKYRGIFYKVVLLRLGHRCGYVEIPNDLNISKQDFSFGSSLRVHGGITYAELEYGISLKQRKVIGFDCGHAMDSADLESTLEHFDDLNDNELTFLNARCKQGTVRSLEYVEAECKSLIDQLLEKYNYGGN